ncbi:MAG: glycosyltransferase family 2 protein, partial [Clostridia bacterium]|nr:glycosyltransferase family 2 protein [Clostridia bacterium]
MCDEVTVSESFNQPLISIIIPVYNAAHYFERCIKSVLEQTYKNLEIILIDDGSTDGSEKLCDQYKEIDDRIKVVHKKNGGQSSARNLGLTMITGDYVGFVDSDDYIEKDMYEYLYNNMVKYHADISICHFYSENSHFTSSE